MRADDKGYFRLLDENGIPVYLYKGTAGMVIKAFSGDLFFCVNDIIYALDEIPIHEQTSRNFNFKKIPAAPKTRYIPDMNHPWRKDNFMGTSMRWNVMKRNMLDEDNYSSHNKAPGNLVLMFR